MHRSHEDTDHDMRVGIPLPMPLVDLQENPLQAEVERLTEQNERLREVNGQLKDSVKFWAKIAHSHVLGRKLERLNISTMTIGALCRYGFHEVREIEHMPDSEMLRLVNGLGKKGIQELRKAIPYTGRK